METDIVKEFEDTVKTLERLYVKYYGCAMSDEVYDRFATLRDDTLPALRQEIRRLIDNPSAYSRGWMEALHASVRDKERQVPVAWGVFNWDGTLATKDGIFTDKEKADNCCNYMSASYSDMYHPVVKPLFI